MHTDLIVCCLLNTGAGNTTGIPTGLPARTDSPGNENCLVAKTLGTSTLRRVNLSPLARQHLSGENPDLGNDRSIADD